MTSRLFDKSSFGTPGTPYNMIVVSLVLHLVLLAAVMFSVPGTSRQLTFGAAYSVALVGPETLKDSSAAGIKDMIQPSKPEHPVILKRDTAAISKTRLFKQEDSSKEDIEKAIRAIKQKDLSKADSANTTKTPAALPPGATTAADSAKANDYSRFIWPKIKKNWVLPASLMPKENVTTIIEVRIAQSGTLEYVGFEKRSGNSYFDESALRAVKKSAPFPPLAGWVSGRSLEIGIRFHSAELR